MPHYKCEKCNKVFKSNSKEPRCPECNRIVYHSKPKKNPNPKEKYEETKLIGKIK